MNGELPPQQPIPPVGTPKPPEISPAAGSEHEISATNNQEFLTDTPLTTARPNSPETDSAPNADHQSNLEFLSGLPDSDDPVTETGPTSDVSHTLFEVAGGSDDDIQPPVLRSADDPAVTALPNDRNGTEVTEESDTINDMAEEEQILQSLNIPNWETMTDEQRDRAYLKAQSNEQLLNIIEGARAEGEEDTEAIDEYISRYERPAYDFDVAAFDRHRILGSTVLRPIVQGISDAVDRKARNAYQKGNAVKISSRAIRAKNEGATDTEISNTINDENVGLPNIAAIPRSVGDRNGRIKHRRDSHKVERALGYVRRLDQLGMAKRPPEYFRELARKRILADAASRPVPRTLDAKRWRELDASGNIIPSQTELDLAARQDVNHPELIPIYHEQGHRYEEPGQEAWSEDRERSLARFAKQAVDELDETGAPVTRQLRLVEDPPEPGAEVEATHEPIEADTEQNVPWLDPNRLARISMAADRQVELQIEHMKDPLKETIIDQYLLHDPNVKRMLGLAENEEFTEEQATAIKKVIARLPQYRGE